MKKLALIASVTIGLLAIVGSVAVASSSDDDTSARLNGYQEVVGPGSISTLGRGRFSAEIDGDSIDFRLTYTLENAATQAHIHFAQRHVGGGVIAFLCGGGGKAPCPSGVGSQATVTGTITAADIIGPATQGIEPTSFAEAVRAIRAGAVYANVHSSRWPMGEIRGQLSRGGDDDDDEDDDD